MPQAARAEATESKRLPEKGGGQAGLPTSGGGMKVSRCRTLRRAGGSLADSPQVSESYPFDDLLEIPGK